MDASDSFKLEVIVSRISDGDAYALSELYNLLGVWLYSLARRVLRSNECAQEIVCDVLGYIWQNAQGFDAKRGTVRAWLAVVTRHRAIDRVRSYRQHDQPFEQLPHSVAWTQIMHPEEVLIQFQEGTSVHAALSSLSPQPSISMALAPS